MVGDVIYEAQWSFEDVSSAIFSRVSKVWYSRHVELDTCVVVYSSLLEQDAMEWTGRKWGPVGEHGNACTKLPSTNTTTWTGLLAITKSGWFQMGNCDLYLGSKLR